MDSFYVWIFQNGDPGFLLSTVYRFLMSIIIILPATLAMGATLPIMNRLLVDQKQEFGNSIALAFGINTIGAVKTLLEIK